MKYWFVQHTVKSYLEHKNMIGHEHKGKISNIKKGDKIIYYATGDMAIIGTFKIKSDIFKLKNDKLWGTLWVYKIKPIKLDREPFLPLKEILAKKKIRLFSKSKMKGIKRRGKTVMEMNKRDFYNIESLIGKYPHPKDLFKGTVNEEGLGEPKELGIMRYTPTNEAGVVVLFAKYMKNLGFSHFDFIRQGFPDACVYEETKNGLQRRFIEFEFKSSMFRQHINNPQHIKIKCDYVVCWEHDYPLCPIKVIELKSELEKFKCKEAI